MAGAADPGLKRGPAELLADLSDLRQQKLNLESREAVILQLLDMILERGGPAAEEVVRLAAEASIALGPLRDQIRHVFASKQASDEWFLAPIMGPSGARSSREPHRHARPRAHDHEKDVRRWGTAAASGVALLVAQRRQQRRRHGGAGHRLRGARVMGVPAAPNKLPQQFAAGGVETRSRVWRLAPGCLPGNPPCSTRAASLAARGPWHSPIVHAVVPVLPSRRERRACASERSGFRNGRI